MPQSKKNQLFGLLGLVGGVFFMIGDCLLYVYPSRDTSLDIDPVFAEMPVWKMIFSGSVISGAWGSCESLGEGLMYLTAMIYWKKAEMEDKA